LIKQVSEIYELLDQADINGLKVIDYLKSRGVENIESQKVMTPKGTTTFLTITIPGKKSRSDSPVLGIIGQLGGIGARPEQIGLVSDAEGCLVALSCALKLADMTKYGDILENDIIITTHICPNAPTKEHFPVPYMDSPVDAQQRNLYLVDPRMSAILSIDTTRGNRWINDNGIALTHPVKEGYILRIHESILDIYERSTGERPKIVPITTQDITPYGNGLYHLNSMLQPSTATTSPVIGLALISKTLISGSATGVCTEHTTEIAARFCIEVAKDLGTARCKFYYEEDFNHLNELYGSMRLLQTKGKK